VFKRIIFSILLVVSGLAHADDVDVYQEVQRLMRQSDYTLNQAIGIYGRRNRLSASDVGYAYANGERRVIREQAARRAQMQRDERPLGAGADWPSRVSPPSSSAVTVNTVVSSTTRPAAASTDPAVLKLQQEQDAAKQKDYTEAFKWLTDTFKYKTAGTFETLANPELVSDKAAIIECAKKFSMATCQSVIGDYHNLAQADASKKITAEQWKEAQAKSEAERQRCETEFKANPGEYVARENEKLIEAARKFNALAERFTERISDFKDNRNLCTQEFANLKKASEEYGKVRTSQNNRCDQTANAWGHAEKMLKEAGLDKIDKHMIMAAGGKIDDVRKVQSKAIAARELAEMIMASGREGKVSLSCQQIGSNMHLDDEKNSLTIKYAWQEPVYRDIPTNCIGSFCFSSQREVVRQLSGELFTVKGELTSDRYRVASIENCRVSERFETEVTGHNVPASDPDKEGNKRTEVRYTFDSEKGFVGMRKATSTFQRMNGPRLSTSSPSDITHMAWKPDPREPYMGCGVMASHHGSNTPGMLDLDRGGRTRYGGAPAVLPIDPRRMGLPSYPGPFMPQDNRGYRGPAHPYVAR